MAVVFNSFFQPASAGGSVVVDVAGSPFINLDDAVRFIKYGVYTATGVTSQSEGVSRYTLTLLERFLQSPTLVPAGTPVLVQGEGVSYSPLSYSTVRYLSFREDDYRAILLSGNITFAAQHHAPAKSITVCVRNLSGTLSRSLSFPSSWIFIGSPGRPASIAASRTGILSITCFGTSDADVIAAWAVQA